MLVVTRRPTRCFRPDRKIHRLLPARQDDRQPAYIDHRVGLWTHPRERYHAKIDPA